MKPWQPILDFWFGDQEPPKPAYRKRWFSGSHELDQRIEERFGELHTRAIEGELIPWLEHPQGRLAKIVIIDQFSRNLFRGTEKAFAWDKLAQEWALHALENGHLKELAMSGRMFCLMPLMHSENVALHERLRVEIESMVRDFPEHTDFTVNFRKAAEDHRVIIERFGRYPHRNKVLGRVSTEAEQEYLAEKNSSFGQ